MQVSRAKKKKNKKTKLWTFQRDGIYCQAMTNHRNCILQYTEEELIKKQPFNIMLLYSLFWKVPKNIWFGEVKAGYIHLGQATLKHLVRGHNIPTYQDYLKQKCQNTQPPGPDAGARRLSR